MSDERSPKPQIVLSVAGFDPSSGAGVTADLQVFAAHGMFGLSALTALTVQSTRGVARVQTTDPVLLRETLSELQADLPPAGIKIGMLGSARIIREVADFLVAIREPAAPVPVVLDPVLRSSSGAGLLETAAVTNLRTELLPLVDWVTPNWQELAVLTQSSVTTEAEARDALELLRRSSSALGVIVTGGDRAEPVDLLHLPGGNMERLRGQHIETPSTHGTGCAFSSALLCGLVKGKAPAAAARDAKRYVEGALRHAPGLGTGRGPMNLLWTRDLPATA